MPDPVAVFRSFDPITGATVTVDKERLESILGGGAEGGNPSTVTINAAAATTLTAAAIIAGNVNRTGMTAARSDTTATAAQLLAALGGSAVASVGSTSWYFNVNNYSAFAETVAGGSGVTLSPTTQIVPPLSSSVFLITYSAITPAFTLELVRVVPLSTSPLLVSTALTTVGAGTITAAEIAGGLTARGGAQSGSAFTDTTDTAALIIAAIPNAKIGESFEWTYYNATDADATLVGGTGVNAAGAVGDVPKCSWATFLTTYTAAATVTMALKNAGPIAVLMPLATALTTVGAGTITAAGIAGLVTTRGGSQSGAVFTDTTDTAANIIAALPNAVIGQSFIYEYVNNTDATATITGGTGVNAAGAVGVVPPATTGRFLVKYTAAATITMTSLGRSAPTSVSGTFVADGTTPVVVANANVTTSSSIIITLKTVGGTVSPSVPYIATITPGTGFSVVGTASDTSTYNYLIIN